MYSLSLQLSIPAGFSLVCFRRLKQTLIATVSSSSSQPLLLTCLLTLCLYFSSLSLSLSLLFCVSVSVSLPFPSPPTSLSFSSLFLQPSHELSTSVSCPNSALSLPVHGVLSMCGPRVAGTLQMTPHLPSQPPRTASSVLWK